MFGVSEIKHPFYKPREAFSGLYLPGHESLSLPASPLPPLGRALLVAPFHHIVPTALSVMGTGSICPLLRSVPKTLIES